MADKIRWSLKAANSLEDICKFISKDSEYYAIFFAKRVFELIRSLEQFPLSGRVVPEYNDKNLREKILDNYRIVYRVKDENIEIVVICHGSKLLSL